MAQRILFFLLLLTACNRGPEVLYENEFVSVVRQEAPKDFDPTAFELYKRKPGGIVLNGGASAIVEHLARTRVQWLEHEEASLKRQSLVVVLQAGVAPENPAVLDAVLAALNARLDPTGNDNTYVYLRAPGVREDIILSTSLHPGGLTQNAALYQFDTAGIHLMNDTGVPLRIDQEVVNFYLPALREQFGMGIDTVEFRLETKVFKGVELVSGG